MLLAAVLGLQGADTATIGAVAVPLSRSFGIGNARIGLIVTMTTVMGAMVTLPAGVLVDRVRRVRLLAGSVAVWTVAMLASGLAPSYSGLMAAQGALGVVLALATPAVTSLTGDLFPTAERGKIYGYILTGELAGAGIGVGVSGSLAAVSWRTAFLVFAMPSLLLAVGLWRLLPEPARGGASRLAPGAREFPDPAGADTPGADTGGTGGGDSGDDGDGSDGLDAVATGIAASGTRPRDDRVLQTDPRRLSLWRAGRHILSLPTNAVLIASSALGYFFLQGLETFITEYFRGRYGLGQVTASLLEIVVGAGAIVGVLVAGRLADRLVRGGRVGGRPLVAGVAFIVSAVVLLPGVLIPTAAIAVPLLFLGVACYGATNPPLDAARLDTVESGLWGRAEAVRSLFRRLFESAAPATFGVVSGWFGAGRATGSGSALPSGGVSLASGLPLAYTFAVMLTPLVAAGLLLCLVAVRTYPRDVATAEAGDGAAAGPPRG